MYYFVLLCLFPLVFGQLMPGGLFEQKDLQNGKLQSIAQFVADDFAAKSKSNTVLKVGENVELIGAKTQVVAGIMYYLKLKITEVDHVEVCDVKVWERTWLDSTKIEKQECHPVAGAQHPTKIDETFKAAAAFAADELNRRSNDYYVNCLTDIRNPKKQVVAGLKYTMDLVMTQSTQTKHGPLISATDGCPVNSDAKTSICHVDVSFQAWMKPKYHLLEPFKCDKVNNDKKVSILKQVKDEQKNHKKPEKRQILGGDDHDDCNGGMFAAFKQKHKKVYASKKEEEKRFTIFCENMKTAKKMQDKEKGTAKYGATKFADLTADEFKKYRNNGKLWDLSATKGMKQAVIPSIKDIPANFDWRTHNAVTPVKNQGSCGSCWAFSTTGNIEGQWSLKKKALVSLSEQELVDCDKKDQGCEGGLPSNAYKEIIRLGGLETEKEYEYEGKDETCHFKKAEVKVYINNSVAISSNETEMAAWLFKNGPISIGINAMAMQFYWGGISHPWKIFCSPDSLDHGVLIVGYGIRDSEPYWIIKNSWGEDWGEKGYYLVYRGGGVCGLNKMCTSSVVE